MKKAMIIIGILLGLFLLLVLTLPYLLDLNRYRDQYIPIVERALNRKVEIPHIQLMWFPLLGVRLEDVKIFDASGRNKHPFVEVSSIVLAVKWKPLLQRRIEVQSLELQQPTVRLIRTKDGKFNATTIGSQEGKSNSPKSDESDKSLLAMFGVEQLRISEGTVTYVDHLQDQEQTYQLENFHMKTEAVKLDDVAKISAQGILTPYQLPMSLEGSLGPLQQNFDVPRIETILKIGNSRVSAKGQVVEGVIDLDITSSKIALEDVPFHLPMNKPVVLTHIFSHVQAPINVEEKSSSSAKELTISPFRFNVEVGKSILEVTGEAIGEQIEIQGTAQIIHSTDLPTSLPLKRSVSVSNFDVKAKIDGLLVHVTALTGEVFGGHLRANGVWDGRSVVPVFRSGGRLQEFRVEEIQKTFQPAAVNLSGRGDINWNMKGTLPTNALPILSGKSKLIIVDGQFKGFDLLQRIEHILRLKNSLSAERGVTSFTKFHGEVEFQKEYYPINTILLEGHEKEFLMKGAGIVTKEQSIQVNGDLQLGHNVSQKIIRQMPVAKVALEEGNLVVPFSVKGSLSEPKIGLDFRSIQKRLQKQVGDTIQKVLQGDPKDVQEILKQGKSFLKGLFGK